MNLFKLCNTLSVFSMDPISYCNFTEFNINCPLNGIIPYISYIK